MIETKHISSIQISFVNVSSKEGAEFLPGDIEVEYYEDARKVSQVLPGEIAEDFIFKLAFAINAKNVKG